MPPSGRTLRAHRSAPVHVAPLHSYPTDLKLLNDAHEKTERIIDDLHAAMPGKVRKPRTYRKNARRDFLNVARSKKPKAARIRTAIGKQLRYIKRNLGHIHSQLDNGASRSDLTAYWHKCLMVIHTLHDQQLGMYQQRSQPHVRPIVRGKVSQRVEFGAKISAVMWTGLFC